MTIRGALRSKGISYTDGQLIVMDAKVRRPRSVPPDTRQQARKTRMLRALKSGRKIDDLAIAGAGLYALRSLADAETIRRNINQYLTPHASGIGVRVSEISGTVLCVLWRS
jgi:hypothetical protein